MSESNDRIQLAHGAGGEVMQDFIRTVVLKHLSGTGSILTNKLEIPLTALDDGAVVDDIVFTIDMHTVFPLFYPGGDIGSLAASGTINDVAVMGAQPLALALGLVIEEGFLVCDTERILTSIRKVCDYAGVAVVTGDTKVVEKGGLREMIIATAGIGRRYADLDANLEVVRASRPFDGRWPNDAALKPGDNIILSGSIGDHGIALLSFREGYGFETGLQSDTAPMNRLIEKAIQTGGVVAMKDPTRGGLANTLNEWCGKSGYGITIQEDALPIKPAVRSACELLGLEPLEIGNEGKVVIAVVPDKAEAVLAAIKTLPEGEDACIIGEVREDIDAVVLETLVGGKRLIDPPVGDPVPRIC